MYWWTLYQGIERIIIFKYCLAHYVFWYLSFWFFGHFSCMIFCKMFSICKARRARWNEKNKTNYILRNILVTSSPKTTKPTDKNWTECVFALFKTANSTILKLLNANKQLKAKTFFDLCLYKLLGHHLESKNLHI